MNSKRLLLTTVMALSVVITTTACDDDTASDGSGDGSADNGDADADGDSDSDSDDDGTTFPTTGDGDGDGDIDGDGDDCGSFLGCDDMGDDPIMFCDFWAQDCPDGEKCTSIASTPGSGAWDAFVCVPEGTEPPGSACQTADGPQGTDTCDKSGLCYDIDAETGIGTCVEYCQAPESAPTCPQSGASVECQKLNQGMLNLCVASCNPLLTGECPSGQNCVAAFEGQELGGFICFPPAAEGISGEECGCANCCSAGHMCVSASDYGPGCQFDLCCTEYCDTEDSSFACQGAGQTCVALFDPSTPEIGNVGQCVVTQ